MIGYQQIDGLVQERRNSIVYALEVRLSCTDPSKWQILPPDLPTGCIVLSDITDHQESSPNIHTTVIYMTYFFGCCVIAWHFQVNECAHHKDEGRSDTGASRDPLEATEVDDSKPSFVSIKYSWTLLARYIYGVINI